MKLHGFRELLLKKAGEDPNLFALLRYAREEVIADKVIEALEKMARARHKGDNANFAVRHFATEMDPETEPHMLREAIGHHVSRYKAAVQGGRKDLANRHAKQAFNLMNVADTTQKHSGGKLSIDYVPVQPWERSHLKEEYDESHPKVIEGKYKAGDFKTKTKGLNYAHKGNNFEFLQGEPHKAYIKEIKRHGHNKAYPFEQVRVNGKYIPVEDIDPSELKGYEEHPFDAHPIMNHYADSPQNRNPEQDAKYVQQHEKYYNESPHIENFYNKHSQLESQNPEEYAKRGSVASTSVHKDIPGLNISGEQESAAPSKAETAVESSPSSVKPIRPDFVEQKHWDMFDEPTKIKLHELNTQAGGKK